MRKLFVILFMLVGIHAVAINIDKRTLDALEHVKQGYVLYGFEELKKAWDAAKETKEAVSVHMFFNPMNNKHIICINDDRYEFIEKK